MIGLAEYREEVVDSAAAECTELQNCVRRDTRRSRIKGQQKPATKCGG